MISLAEAGARLLGSEIAEAQALHGGDLSSVLLLFLRDGRRVVVKSGPAPRIEAAMLSALSSAGVKAPAVLAVHNTVLVIDYIEATGSLGSAWQDLGSQMARQHQATGPGYGWAEDYAFGPVVIENAWSESWPEFYARHRLLPHLPFLPAPLARRVEVLAEDLENRLPRHPSPALLHGDLWGGNVLAAGDTVAALIDPACIYGDAEVDLAMLGLFDRPGSIFYEAYGPRAAGHSDRLPIYQLWPALVHLRLFGQSYRGMVEAFLHQAGV